MSSEAMEAMEVPEGGLASFLTSNLDEIDDSVLAFGRGEGINSMREVAERMAKMGRNGDNYIIHATESEMIVPREVVEKNPELRQRIMESIAAEGADPEAYIVGSEANSINPMTGQPEFFLKKIVRAVKKIGKKVVNVVKKVAPVVLPFALNAVFPGMGTIASGALGAGIGTLVQGGNFKDALKAAALGGAGGALYSGMSSVFQGGGFMQGVQGGLPAAFRPAAPVTMSTSGLPAAGEAAAAPATERTFMDRLLGRNLPTQAETLASERMRLSSLFPNATPAEIDSYLLTSGAGSAAAQPSVLQRFGPQLAAGLGIGALTGAFDPVEAEPLTIPGYEQTSRQRLESDPTRYSVGMGGPYYSIAPGDVRVYPTSNAPIRLAAEGGEMESFPRRIGAISGPGTETSDDVPAMLSDGEFVMTARAVRGAGNGSREKGVRRMYDMMRMFEGGVAR